MNSEALFRRVSDLDRQRRRVHLTQRDRRIGASLGDGRAALEAAVVRATNLEWNVSRWSVERGEVFRVPPPSVVEVLEGLDAGEEGDYVWFFLDLPGEDVLSGNGFPRALLPLPAAWEGDAMGDRVVGEVVMYGGLDQPAGWLVCNGQEVSRETYADLFAVLGESYGAGDGSTTFNVPNLAQRFALFQDFLEVPPHLPRGFKAGKAFQTLGVGQLPAHSHAVTVQNEDGGSGSFDVVDRVRSNREPAFVSNNAIVTEEVGGGNAFDNRPPFLTIGALIFAGV